MKKRIAIVGVGMLGTGALNQGIPAMVKALERQAELYDITVYSFIRVEKKYIPRKIRVRSVPSNGLHQYLQYFLLGICFLYDHLRNRYSVLHAQSPFPAGVFLLFFYWLKIPLVVSLHAGETARIPDWNFGELLKPDLARITTKVCTRATVLTTMSKYQADMTKQNLQLTREIKIIPRGIEIIDNSAHNEDKTAFIHISNYHPIKDYATLFKAFCQVRKEMDCRLIIIGSGYPPEIFQLVESLGIKEAIDFKGAISHNEIETYLKKSSVLIQTSQYEALPMTALEAMAAGVVICGTHVGIMADLANSCCLTSPPGKHSLLAENILRVVSDQDLYASLQEKAFQWIQEHSMDWYIQEWRSIYDNLAE